MEEGGREAKDLEVGSDRILFKEGHLIIHSRCDMIDWRATKYRKTLVLFNGVTYFLDRKSQLPDGMFHYKLERLKGDYHDIPSKIVPYDEAYVLERDAFYRKLEKRRKTWMILRFTQPLLGFLPSSVKEKLHDTYGLHPVTMTAYSLFLEYLFVLLASTLFVIHLFTRALGSLFDFAPVAVIVTLLDAMIRYNCVFSEMDVPFGFYEWIFKVSLR